MRQMNAQCGCVWCVCVYILVYVHKQRCQVASKCRLADPCEPSEEFGKIAGHVERLLRILAQMFPCQWQQLMRQSLPRLCSIWSANVISCFSRAQPEHRIATTTTTNTWGICQSKSPQSIYRKCNEIDVHEPAYGFDFIEFHFYSLVSSICHPIFVQYGATIVRRTWAVNGTGVRRRPVGRWANEYYYWHRRFMCDGHWRRTNM